MKFVLLTVINHSEFFVGSDFFSVELDSNLNRRKVIREATAFAVRPKRECECGKRSEHHVLRYLSQLDSLNNSNNNNNKGNAENRGCKLTAQSQMCRFLGYVRP